MTQNKKVTASDLLLTAANMIAERSKQRDVDSERSMALAVELFNEHNKTNMTEKQGWNFMYHLKRARSMQGSLLIDDWVDMIAYLALEAESVINK